MGDDALRSLLISALERGLSLSDKEAPRFKLFRRARALDARGHKQKPIYYVQVWDDWAEKYITARTTKLTSEPSARTWAALHAAEILAEHRKKHLPEPASSIIFEDFARDFFEEDSDYITYREQRGHGMGFVHRKHNATYLRLYIEPFFKGMRIDSISPETIEDFQSALLKPQGSGKTISPTTANHITQALRHIMTWAKKKKMSSIDAFDGVDPLAEKPKARGVLTAAEVRTILAPNPKAWPDPLALLLNRTAARTGLRSGELQALRRRDIEALPLPDGRNAGLITVSHSWERRGVLKAPKSGKSRSVIIPPRLYEEIAAVLDASPWKDPDSFVFYSAEPTKPMSHKKIDKDFRRAVNTIGLSEEARQARSISFHSWRHFANSMLLNEGIPLIRVQAQIGHQSQAMSEKYYHVGEDEVRIVAALERGFGELEGVIID